MSQMQKGRELTLVAGADLSAKQYFIGALDTAIPGEVILANAQTLPIIGVLENYPEEGDTATVIMPQDGTAKVKLGGTVTTGDYITADSAGKGITTTTSNDMVIGRALQDGVSGDIIEVALMFFRY